ncbi:MAG TPA: NfeD family protein [Gammaproteobacteria bacterium]|nr:NfeD family protein [Gammaproteobacteria bacterium]
MGFDAWHGWLILALLLALAEVFAGSFTLLAVALACAVGALVAATSGASLMLQVGVVSVAAAVLGPLLVKAVRPYLRADAAAGPVGTGAEPGTVATVVREGDSVGIRYQGNRFPVRSAEGESVREGQRVVIRYFEGITAVVSPAGDDHEEDR